MSVDTFVSRSLFATVLLAAPMARAQVPPPSSEPAPPPDPSGAYGVPPPGGYGAPPQGYGQPMPVMAQPPPPPPVDPEEKEKWERAHFSGGRWVVEMLAGAVLGTLASYGVYEAAGEGIGGAFAGIATGFVVTPLVEYGTGRAMGGQGSLMSTYLGGLIGFSASAPATQGGEVVVLVIAEILCPITSGLFFEFSSNGRARTWQMQHGVTVSVLPVGPIGHSDGYTVGAALRW